MKGAYDGEAGGCPACGGHTGHRHTMTESHTMSGSWGEMAEAGYSGINVKRSFVECLDCGVKFQHAHLVRQGLL